jgi:hypothetical protein
MLSWGLLSPFSKIEPKMEEDELPSSLPQSAKSVKPPLSHTISLPVTSREHSGANKSSAVAAGSTDTVTADTSAAAKSWSFGNMAKAVGCGMTAFGSGVVHSSIAVAQATGTGVVQGSKAVGEGVVQGTKVAGRVTIAAGKGVCQAGEIVGSGVVSGVSVIGNTTVQAGKASVSAVQDTTKWVKEQTESIIGECQIHVVLPDETFSDICNEYNIEPVHLIKANGLMTRNIRVGKELYIPNTTNLNEVARLHHERDMLQVNASKIVGNSETEGTLHVTYESLFFCSRSVFEEIKNIDVEKIAFTSLPNQEHENVPDLLPPELIMNEEHEQVLPQEQKSGSGGDDCSSNKVFDVKLERDRAATSQEEEMQHVWLELTGESVSEQKTFKLTLQNTEAVLEYCELWHSKENICVQDSIRQVIQNLEEESVQIDLQANSHILSEDLIQQLHKMLPSKTQSSRWSKVFSSVEDGYSLQNFYRKVIEEDEPFLLVVSDENNDVFGAYLTCTPKVSDGFIGTGKSWVFSVQNETIKVFRWSGKNDYFFQGQQSCLIIGADDGKFGIYIDGDLNNGRLQKCETFVAWPDIEKDFVVKYFECWNFV